MKRYLSLGPRRFQLELGGEGGEGVAFEDRAALRRLLTEGDNRAVIRALLARDPGAGAVDRLDDEHVAAALGRMLADGRARLHEDQQPPLRGIDGLEVEDEPPPASARQARAELTWIEIRLIGEDDKPIPGERYRIELPDGSVRDGRLDGEGRQRVEGIDPGTCTVTFPELDEEAWARV